MAEQGRHGGEKVQRQAHSIRKPPWDPGTFRLNGGSPVSHCDGPSARGGAGDPENAAYCSRSLLTLVADLGPELGLRESPPLGGRQVKT